MAAKNRRKINPLEILWCLCVYVCLCVDLLSLDQSKTFYKPDWFDIVGEEVKCCKEAVCVIDMSSFTKFEVTVSQRAVTSFNQELGYQALLSVAKMEMRF